MKKLSVLIIIAVAMTVIGITPCRSQNNNPVIVSSEVDSVSYIIGKISGYSIVKQAKTNMEAWPVKGNYDALLKGLSDALNNPDEESFLGFDTESAGEYINNFFQSMSEKAANENNAAAEKFLTENKGRDGVVTTESGLQYKILTEGTGPKPTEEDEVMVHYIGKSMDGTVFESTYDRGEPASIPLANVIRGWGEGLRLMSVGSKYLLWIPPDLGYGSNPPTPKIKPNDVLEFEIELLKINEM
jgi:FKBP-type peptidyl-prolyl cis-trans isomerases 1